MPGERTTTAVSVDVPPAVETKARERAERAGEPDRLDAYILDYVEFEFEFEFQQE